MVRPGAEASTFPLGRFRANTNGMAKSIRVYTKSSRAPEAGTMVGVRLQAPQLQILDAWIGHQPDGVSRPEAIRRLLQLGLQAAREQRGLDEKSSPHRLVSPPNHRL